MRQVIETAIPQSSKILTALPRFHFSDAYQVVLSKPDITPQQIYEAVFNHPPAWVGPLFAVRGWVAKLFGLKHLPIDFQQRAETTHPYVVGERAGLFSVQSTEPWELILGDNDSHLDFRLSIYKTRAGTTEMVTVSTIVQIHNTVGRLYMTAIKPFHRMLAKSMLQRAVDAERL